MTEIPAVRREEGTWAIVRLGPSESVPAWLPAGGFSSVTRTADELSIVCGESAVPPEIAREGGWALLKLAGPFPFTAVGVLDALLAPLARAGVSVFAISTFDTDYLLVKRERVGVALEALESERDVRRRREAERDVERRAEPND